MFGQFVRATTSLITTTSANLFSTSGELTVSSATSFAKAVESQVTATANAAIGVTKLDVAALAIGTGVVAAGSALGLGYAVTGVLGIANGLIGSTATAAVKSVMTEATVLIVRNSTATVAGTGVLHTLLNGQMIVDGFKDISKAVKGQYDAGYYLTSAAYNGVKAAGYTVAGTGLKTVEKLEQYAGSDQDGKGEDAGHTTKSVDLAQNDAELGQKIEKLYEDQAALNKTVLVVNEAIANLKGDNEIIQAVKAGQKVVIPIATINTVHLSSLYT